MNPVSRLHFFLSNDGLAELRARFLPPEGAFNVEYNQDLETCHYNYFSYPDNEEKEYTLSFPLFLKSELEQLLVSVSKYMDERVVSLDSANERKEFILPVLTRLDLAINHWISLPSSTHYADSTGVLESFKTQIHTQLTPFLDSNPALQEMNMKSRVQNLPEGFSLRDHNLKADPLNFRQTALLFDYLREFGAIIDYDNKPLSDFIHLLTGHSSQSLRGNGFGKLGYIKDGLNERGEPKKDRNEELRSLKELLHSIIAKLEVEIEENNLPKK